MASILVIIDLKEGRPTPAVLGAMTFARALATDRGATLYALLPANRPLTCADDDVCAVLSRYGADRLLVVSDPRLDAPPNVDAWSPLALHVRERIRPSIVVLTDGPLADTVAPIIAATLGMHTEVVTQHSRPSFRDHGPTLLRLAADFPGIESSTDEAEVIALALS